MLGNEDRSTARDGARAILMAFDQFHAEFKRITRRAKARFEGQDWIGAHADAVERLDLYGRVIDRIVPDIREILGNNAKNHFDWSLMKAAYTGLIFGRDDFELAETFFNSVSRKIFTTVGVASNIEYVDSDFDASSSAVERHTYQSYIPQGSTEKLLREILSSYHFRENYENLARDIVLAAKEVDAHLLSAFCSNRIEEVQMNKSVFYRGKGAYLVGRIINGEQVCPLVFALVNTGQGIAVDAVLMTSDDVSIIFSFARSYFHVEAEIPHQMVSFLKSIMPLKRVAELYISIGYNKHGKTELYRDLLHHLENSQDKFVTARGEKGMVMVVFTLPSFDLVFKVIKDHFPEPKTNSRQDVMDKYRLVFKHDRAGRLADAQEFEYLKFDRRRFSEDLLNELLSTAANTVQLKGDEVIVRHLYVERRMIPLDIYVREMDEAAVMEAVLDYGQALKDLAATNIFPGDILIKNFGVTRHRRVIFYDYDEVTLLTDCRFRRIPQTSDYADEFAAEPWFFVGKNDIFPEEFKTFLGFHEPYREAFCQAYEDLFRIDFWKSMQKRHQASEVMDIFPYKQSMRIR